MPCVQDNVGNSREMMCAVECIECGLACMHGQSRFILFVDSCA